MAKLRRQRYTANDISWGKAYDLYEEEKSRYNVSEKTLFNYRNAFIKWNKVFELEEDASIADATAYSYDEFIDVLRTYNLKPESINTYVRNINHFFHWLESGNFIALRTLFLNRYDEFAELRPHSKAKKPLWLRIEEL